MVKPRKEFAPQTTTELERDGPRPKEPAEIFTIYNLVSYRIDKEQLIPLHKCADTQIAERLRHETGRQRLVVNAGKPTQANPNAGACFHGEFEYTPKYAEVYEVEYHEPKPLTARLGSLVYCSSADAIARYAGGKALTESAELFMILFLNGGESQLAPVPAPDAPPGEEYTRQRGRILQNLHKLFLVCPFRAKPCVCPHGWPYPVHSPDSDMTKMMLGCFASIVSDKREGAPAREASICGYHDKCRLHILPRAHVRKIRQLVAYFNLENDLPVVWDHLEDGQMSLEAYRQREARRIREQFPGLVPHRPEWQDHHATMLFGKPWVQRCNMDNPGGEEHDDGSGSPPRPVLVPLVRGGAEEHNGVPWLHLDEEDDSAHAWTVRDALVRIAGRTPNRRPAPKEDAVTVEALKRALASANAKIAECEAGFARVARAFPEAVHHYKGR